MRVIISTDLEDNFANFKVVRSFKEIAELEGVDLLIIHKFNEDDFDVGVFISKFHKSGISNFVYMSTSPHIIVKMVVQGVKGIVCSDEFYLDDEEELEEYLKTVGIDAEGDCTSLANVSVQVVKDFIQAFARGEDRIKTPAYLAQVNQAITDLSSLTKQQEFQITTMGNSAIKIFERASLIIKSMDERRKQIENKLTELEESQSSSSSVNSFSSNTVFFPSYRYLGTKRVLFIRELSPCRYLTSFILGYEHHLHFDMNKRVKLIFVHQKGSCVAAKYSDFTNITQESMNLASLYDSEIISTNNPKKEVMRDLLDKGMDVFIVVDRLYSNNDIVTGKVLKFNAISGMTDLDRFKVKPQDCICSVAGNDDMLYCIPTVKDYVKEVDARRATYLQLCENIYNDLDNRLGLDMM